MKKSNIQKLFFGIFCFVGISANLIGQTKPEKINQLIQAYADQGKFNGSALVSENGSVIFKKGFGQANMEWDIANAPDTKHRLGSITKQFTAALVLQLVEKGKLDLNAPISKYLPDYPKATGDKITLHHLLTHTSGVPSYTSFPNFFSETSRDYYSPKDFVKLFCDLPLEFAPGEKFNYSNSGYFLIGYIIETVTGKSYETCLQENIFTPLQMNDTGFDHHENILKHRASGYEKKPGGYVNANYLDMALPYAAGSMYSTVEDLYRWDQALYKDKVLSAKSRDLMFSKHFPAWGEHYGYGWSIADIDGFKPNAKINITEHGGGINGFNTIISRITTDKNLVVLLNNTGSAPLGKVNEAIRNILYGKPYEMPKRSIADALLPIIHKSNVADAKAKFIELKKSNDYALDESEMNRLGYELLSTGKIADAIEIFKLNVESFPKSGNAYDSLGEAYLKNGNKDLAIANYKKSIALDPTNENGKKVLAEITK
ncbi:MAG: serine hydrolase [Flavobacterium sp.]|uniref:serine hydrolase n=1 Tax=Flavobacterium sp. TaxID=239 RepID=UPI0011F5C0F1|nr:serine hydrolase [Flavobacterium sp.]RZJ68726.1 MAG: serine hydrolase [Flavobacterium sp.]